MKKTAISILFVLISIAINAQMITLVEWNFDTDFEGWTFKPELQAIVDGGILKLDAQDEDPYMFSSTLNILTEVHTEVMVRMRNYTSSSSGQVYFVTTDSPAYSGDLRVDFTTTPNDAGYTDYHIDMSQNVYWQGTVTQIRFDPGTSGNYDVDFIKIRGEVCEHQIIEFSEIESKLITDNPFEIFATSNSDLPIDIAILSGPATINDNIVTLTGQPGYVILTANQPVDSNFCAAAKATQSFYVRLPDYPTVSNQILTEGDQWVATDDLGRVLSGHKDVGDNRSGKYVGIFYFLWHGNHGSSSILDITKIIEANPSDPEYGDGHAFHWWGESEDGYYKANDPWVIRRQLEMLSAAGVDFLYIDVTNEALYLSTVDVLCQISLDMRQKGIKTPYITFVTKYNSGFHMNELYDKFYSLEKYKDLWFIWDAKPLIFGVTEDPALRTEVRNFFTIRFSWYNTDTQNNPFHWQELDQYPQNYGWDVDPDVPTQMVVGKGIGPVNLIPKGDSYTSTDPVTYDQYYLTEYTGQGRHLSEHFEYALEIDPEVIMITGWNEWIANRWISPGPELPFLGKPTEAGDTYFVDVYNQEFNRDIAPMKDGHTDNHYYLMIDYIRQFKGMAPQSAFSSPQSITINGNFAEWQAVTPVFKDYEGDVAHRNFSSFANEYTYTNTTGRNDIIESKSIYDDDSLYFYVKTAQTLTSHSDPNWMLLFLDVDRNKGTGWEGYDYVVNYGVTSDSQTTLKKWNGVNWGDEKAIEYSVNGSEMELSIPRSAVRMSDGTPEFYFHWADNPPNLDDISAFFVDGESAPDRRFNYNYSTSTPVTEEQSAYTTQTIPGTLEFENFDNGGVGVAYADADIENNGGEYRTDESVDIEAKTGGGYNVSWINTGEWLEYTIISNAVGEFTAVIHYASDVDTCSAGIYLDGVDISGVFTFPSTGGMQTWATKEIPIQMNAGTHILKFHINSSVGNLALDKIEFTENNIAYPGEGTGLMKSLWEAAYGGREWFTDSICGEVDSVIAEVWEDKSPGCEIKKNFWSARWEGQIQALFTETYTFYLTFNDIASLWINNRQVIDGWHTGLAGKTLTATVDMAAGEKVPIRVDFGKKTGEAYVKLEWSSASNLRQVVPQSQFFPEISTKISQSNLKKPVIYPNPAENTLHISTYGSTIEKVIIYDMHGRTIFIDNEPFSENRSINVQPWERGVYLIQLFEREQVSIQKVVIK